MSNKNIITSYIRNIIILAAIALIFYAVSYAVSPPYPISLVFIFIVNGIFIPIIVFLILNLAGNLLMSRNINALKALGMVITRLISPAISIYLIFTALIPILLPLNTFINITTAIMTAYLVILGLLTRSFGTVLGHTTRESIRGLGTTIALFGMAMLTLQIYASLYTLYTQSIIPMSILILTSAIYNAFLYAAVTSIVITAIVSLGFLTPLRPVSMDMAHISGDTMYIVAIIGMAIILGTLTPYDNYITALSISALVIITALISYRLITAYLRLGESRVRDIYSEYASKVMGKIVNNDYELINAMNDFMANGNKEPLLRYLTNMPTHCSDVRIKALGRLRRYKPPYYGGLWPWETSGIKTKAVKDAEIRTKIATEIITLISTCQEEKQAIQVSAQPTTPPTAPTAQYIAEDGTRIYAQPTEELPVKPLEEETKTKQEGTVIKQEETTTTKSKDEQKGNK
ncbi:hypothetical protein [Vulcanisaeta sp. JCM 14467]|uniref:hypothetical protein n=1 Tax=Vulcanisaeta sp. JCM 14467 TaxID=1295370 RepID=UPI000AE05112|nr:hypothetical protein [Vulcanisaeta sp. JCM 14467]